MRQLLAAFLIVLTTTLAACGSVGLLQVGAPQALQFGGGDQTRGIMKWQPLYGMSSSCTATPATCYTGGGGVAAQLNTTWLNKLCADGIGHMRVGIDPGPLLSNPANAATYYTDIFAALDQVGTSCQKIVMNITPSFTYTDWTYVDIQAGGLASVKFQAYLTMLDGLLAQVASRVISNPSVYGPARFAIDLYNETPAAVSVTGGIDAQYAMMVAGWQHARAILPKHTLIICLSAACDTNATTTYASWDTANFDANTIVDFHNYYPPTFGFAGFPGSIWRDIYNQTWPPTTGAYTATKLAYEQALSLDTTWAGDCSSTGSTTASATGGTMTTSGGSPAKWQTISGTGITAGTYIQSGSGTTWTIVGTSNFSSTTVTLTGGSTCTTNRQANYDVNTNSPFSYQFLQCTYGQGAGVFPCAAGQAEGVAWLTTFYGTIETWRQAKSYRTSQIYIGEFGAPGTWGSGVGLSGANQAAFLGDTVGVINPLGYSWCVLEVNYTTDTAHGLYNTSNPYASVNAAAITALQFNGR